MTGAWLITTDEGKKLRISEDEGGTKLWMEAARAEMAAERSAKEAERSAKEAALARLAELEVELAKRRGVGSKGVSHADLRTPDVRTCLR